MLQRFIFVNLSKGLPATNRESPEGEGALRLPLRPLLVGTCAFKIPALT